MGFGTGSRRCLVILATALATALAAGACDDGVTALGDAGTDAGTDTDVDTDADADSDADADAGPDPDGGGFVCEIDPERVLADVAFLASEELGGRYPGSEGNELAMEAGEALFAALGLEPAGDDGGYRQVFDFESWSVLAPPALSIDGDLLAPGNDYAVFGYSGTAEVTAEVVYVGYGMTVPAYDPADYPDCPLPATGYDDYAGVDVTGKIALVVRHGPDDDDSVPDECPDNGLCGAEPCLWNFTYKAANADLHGAAAMIVVQNYGNPPAYLAGASLSGGYIDDFAAVFADRDAVEASIAELETWTDAIDGSLAPFPVETGVEATVDVAAAVSTIPTANLLGAIPGSDPELGDEVVFVGGHIDHLGIDGATGDIYPGADDNASGSAVTMELARIASQCATPARTVVFALWNAEEEGLLGSIHYVQHPTYPIESTIANLNADMVGVGQDTNIVLYGAAADANAWIAQVMAGSAEEMGYGWAVTPGAVSEFSDHWPFAYLGVPAVCAMSGPLESHPYYHTPADTIETIGITHLEMSASMLWAGLKPLMEGTEEIYLTSDKALRRGAVPAPRSENDRFLQIR
jgi:hypothetical protein